MPNQICLKKYYYLVTIIFTVNVYFRLRSGFLNSIDTYSRLKFVCCAGGEWLALIVHIY